MKIKQIITDYIMKSILTTEGDMVVRGATEPQKLTAPVIGYWLQGLGAGVKPAWTANLGGVTTKGDLIVRGTTICQKITAVAVGQVLKSAGVGAHPAWGKPSISDLGFFIGAFTRSIDGDYPITGLGFLPKVILFFTVDGDSSLQNFAWGFDDGTTHGCMYLYDDMTVSTTTEAYCFHIRRDAGNYMRGVVSAIGADGFTLTCTLVGATIVKVNYLAIG